MGKDILGFLVLSKVFFRCGFVASRGFNINAALTNIDYKVGKAGDRWQVTCDKWHIYFIVGIFLVFVLLFEHIDRFNISWMRFCKMMHLSDIPESQQKSWWKKVFLSENLYLSLKCVLSSWCHFAIWHDMASYLMLGTHNNLKRPLLALVWKPLKPI